MRFKSLALVATLAVSLTGAYTVLGGGQDAEAFSAASPTGVDVSLWQHPGGNPIDWQQVRLAGNSFAIVKATEGLGYVNPHFAEDSAAAAEAGLIVGSYHMGRAHESAALQAAEYAAALASQPQPSLPPVLDIEYNNGVSPAGMQAWIREFVTEIERLTGRKPIIYTYRYFWEQEVGNTTEFSDYPLWLAAYQSTPPTVMPGGWDNMVMWQNSGNDRVPGIAVDVDTNIFNGDESQLHSFVAGNYFALNMPKLDLAPAFDALAQANPALVGAILAAAAGVVAVGGIVTAAQSMGVDTGIAGQLADQVSTLINTGQLPVADLENMLRVGTYSIGDLLKLLEVANQTLAEVSQN